MCETSPKIIAGKLSNGITIIKVINTGERKADIKAVVDYLWEDEHKHFQEGHYPKKHIYRILKRIESSYE